MKIYRSTKTNRKTQAFGENKACAKVYKNGKPVKPWKIVGTNTGTCPSGYDFFYPLLNMKGHNGEDWATWRGESLYFNVDALDQKGNIMEWWSRSGVDASGGIGIDVFSARRVYLKELPPQAGELAKREWGENNGWVYVKFRFWHLQKVMIKDARRPNPSDPRPQPNVWLGTLIGKCDSTGASGGDHLHWSMKIVAKNSMTLDGDNGYTGAVDFSPWFDNRFVVDVIDDLQEQINSLIDQLNRMILSLKIAFKKL